MVKNIRKPFIILILALVIALIAVAAYFYSSKRSREAKKELTLYGNVDIRQVDLGFRVFGRVKMLLVDEGDEVEPGQLLAQLDSTPYEEEVRKAEANQQAVSLDLKNAALKKERRQQVVEGSVTEEDYIDSISQEEVLRANLAAAKAALDSSMTSLQDTKLFAPSKGIILTRIREPGSVLNAGNPVFTLSLEEPLWIRAYVSEKDLGFIYPGQLADIYTDSSNLPVFRGHIGFISPVAEFTPKNVETVDLRTDLVYRLRIIVEHPTTRLHQGMPVTVKLYENKPPAAKRTTTPFQAASRPLSLHKAPAIGARNLGSH